MIIILFIIISNIIKSMEENININQNIRNILRKKIIKIIHCDLTIGRTDADLQPLEENEINNFITNNNNNIEQTINTMIHDYEEDGELEELVNPENDWILEYLYDFVKTTV